MKLEELVAKARDGDRSALEELLESIQDRLYNLSLRMLWHPQDAEDATQEILIRIFTHLGTFRGESSFLTWVYRVASNHLLTSRKRRMESMHLTFDAFAKDLDQGLDPITVDPEAETRLLAEEVKIGCTHAMLLCLDRKHRLAYILGEIFELKGDEAASALEISHNVFRKRLSRARSSISEFMKRKCGIVNPENSCRCAKRIRYATETGRITPENLLFVKPTMTVRSVRNEVQRLDQLKDAAALLKSHPEYSAPESLRKGIQKLISLVNK